MNERRMIVVPPATLEGWYALHQVFATEWTSLEALHQPDRARLVDEVGGMFGGSSVTEGGWSAAFRLVGGGADWLFVHFRPTLDDLAEAQAAVKRSRLGRHLRLTYDYLSVTEAGLYYATSEVTREHEPRSPAFERELAARSEEEAGSEHIRSRLFPRLPEEMRYVSFYPMSKRRRVDQNWYTLSIEERNRLMKDHGLTGRRYGGRVFQVISGSVGLDDWEWGVTLFARDPLEFKRIVTEMRYDEASSVYGEFGQFFTGIRVSRDEWPGLLLGADAPR
jgi:hydrogen peroxide-dependent heme synthase